MSFWEKHAASEAKIARILREADEARWAPPDECLHCHKIKSDVLLGICDGCFARHEEGIRGRA